ncbi:hypothetical protein [Priestia aryabhattai]|uniref:hypothetical protein n=1 Tax=Priestia aryabhattai TaxID=412384 RepID=UPI003D2674F5
MNPLFDLLLNLLRIKKGICIYFTVTLLNSLTITLKLNAFNPFDNTITGVDANNIPITINIQDIVSIKFSIGRCCKTFAYVTNLGSSDVSVIDTSTNTVVDTIHIGPAPISIAATPDGSRIYVTQLSIPEVSIIDTATNTVVDTISLGPVGGALGITITPDGSRAYVYFNVNSFGIYVIDTATNTIIDTVTPPVIAFGMAITPDGSRVYATDIDPGSSKVLVINTTTNTVTNTIPSTPNTITPLGIAITPDGLRAYVTNYGLSNVSVIDTTTNMIIDVIHVGTAPEGIAITPDGSRVYVSTVNNVIVINTSTNNVIATIPNLNGSTLFAANEIAITSDGSRAYVANQANNTVSVINTSTNAITNTIQVGTTPNGIALINKCT